MSYARRSLNQLYRNIEAMDMQYISEWKSIKDLHGMSGVEEAEHIGYSKGVKEVLKKIKNIIIIMADKPLRDDDRDYRVEKILREMMTTKTYRKQMEIPSVKKWEKKGHF